MLRILDQHLPFKLASALGGARVACDYHYAIWLAGFTNGAADVFEHSPYESLSFIE